MPPHGHEYLLNAPEAAAAGSHAHAHEHEHEHGHEHGGVPQDPVRLTRRRRASWGPWAALAGACAASWWATGWGLLTWSLVVVAALDGACRRVRKSGLWQNLHLLFYAVFTLTYIGGLLWVIRRLPRPIACFLAGKMGQTYHAKTMTHEDAKAFITYKGEIRHDLGEKIIPYEIARTLVLKGPTKVGVIQCPCRASKEHGCTPMDVCMVLGSFVDPTAKLKPLRYLTTQEAVELLEAEHKRGHVHTVWFKDIFDGRAFALCNCCKCCCGGIEIMMKYDAHNMISSGYVASRSDITNTAETASPSQAAGCVGCGMCARSCPFNAITLSPGKGAIVDQSKCLGCGVCVEKCPKKCLKLQRDPTKPPPLALNELF